MSGGPGPTLGVPMLGCIYIRAKIKAKAIIFSDLLPLTHRCSINTKIGNNATGRKRCCFRVRFRSNINAPLVGSWSQDCGWDSLTDFFFVIRELSDVSGNWCQVSRRNLP